MIVEVFQHADREWAFRRIDLLGVQEHEGRYATREEALAAAGETYPGVAATVIAGEDET
ncbi:hypothetical protein ACOTFF_03510 [Achromobacter xylosoxidans]